MKKLLAFIILPLVAGCGSSEPPLVGKMIEKSICNTAGSIIRQSLGNNFKTVGVPCSVQKLNENKVQISSAYISPLGTTLQYTA